MTEIIIAGKKYDEKNIRKIIILEQYEDVFNLLVTANDNEWRIYSRIPLSNEQLKNTLNHIYNLNPNVQTKRVKSFKMVVPAEWLNPHTRMEI